MTTLQQGKYGPETALVDFIYGITFEIWEERQVELIRQYYASEVEVFALSGVTTDVDAVVTGTYAMQQAFPDRLLLAENVVWSNEDGQAYSSHRILSPMTHTGHALYGQATNRRVVVRTIADCVVEEGVIVKEWLIRDTLPLVKQLGLDPIVLARENAARRDDLTSDWMSAESARVLQGRDAVAQHVWKDFARQALQAMWINTDELAKSYAPYAVLHPDPQRTVSGLNGIVSYARALQRCFAGATITVDHIAVQPWAAEGFDIAVRWGAVAHHAGDYEGLPATQRSIYILGSSHWRVLADRIATDWTVFDGLAVLAQLVD